MPRKNNDNNRLYGIIVIVITAVCVIAGLIFFKYRSTEDTANQTAESFESQTDQTVIQTKMTEEGAVQGQIIVKPKIDYHDLKQDETLKEMMVDRKKSLGINKSLDMIVNSDETFKVGDNMVSMKDILIQTQIEKGEVHIQSVKDPGSTLPKRIKKYGIYVVQPNDNIWNIHFNFLKEYYENQGINLSPRADEPTNSGMSSGVGKILKFSENMVVIYNMVDKKLSTNIDLLEPLSKVVVYNMDEVFSLLSNINYENIDRLQFDGKTIWIPAKK